MTITFMSWISFILSCIHVGIIYELVAFSWLLTWLLLRCIWVSAVTFYVEILSCMITWWFIRRRDDYFLFIYCNCMIYCLNRNRVSVTSWYQSHVGLFWTKTRWITCCIWMVCWVTFGTCRAVLLLFLPVVWFCLLEVRWLAEMVGMTMRLQRLWLQWLKL